MAEVIEDWKRVKDLELAAQALRQEKINTHTVVLRALGGLGNTLFEHHPKDWRTRLLGLKDIDWRKSVGSRVNPLWDNVCIVAGSVVSNRQARVATQGALKDWLKVPLSNQENQVLTSLRQKGWVGSNGQPLQIELTLDKADSPNTSYGGDHNG
jgi:DNA sulfur modification protein DndB